MPLSDVRTTPVPAARGGSRFVPSEEIDRVRSWSFESVDVDPDAQVHPAEAKWEAAAEVRARESWESGYREGLQFAREAAAREHENAMQAYLNGEARAFAERLGGLLANAEASLLGIHEQLAAQIIDIACATARQIVRRELLIDLKALRPTIDEAIEQLLVDAKVAVVRLSVTDHAVLSEDLRAHYADGQLELVLDPTLAPGDCIVQAAGVQIDGSMQTRWRRAVERLGHHETWTRSDHGDGG